MKGKGEVGEGFCRIFRLFGRGRPGLGGERSPLLLALFVMYLLVNQTIGIDKRSSKTADRDDFFAKEKAEILSPARQHREGIGGGGVPDI